MCVLILRGTSIQGIGIVSPPGYVKVLHHGMATKHGMGRADSRHYNGLTVEPL